MLRRPATLDKCAPRRIDVDDRVYQQLNLFLDQHFPYCAGKFGPDSAVDATRYPCRDLLGEDCFSATAGAWVDRHSGVDRRAALSVWSMYYFSHLAISPAVLWLMFRHAIPASPEHLDLRLDAVTGLPDTFVVRDPEARPPASTIHDAFEPLLYHHAAPLIATFAHFGLSPRLLWSNLAVYVEWIVGEIGKMDPALGREGLQLVECTHWPDGRPNPLHGLLNRHCGDDGVECTRRRVCCLRYLLPSVPGCGMICPLPAGRA
jgi:ferric iron reductase protein FhuF